MTSKQDEVDYYGEYVAAMRGLLRQIDVFTVTDTIESDYALEAAWVRMDKAHNSFSRSFMPSRRKRITLASHLRLLKKP